MKMTEKNKKVVAVAKDVLKQLKAKTLKAKHRMYVDIKKLGNKKIPVNMENDKLYDRRLSMQLKDVFKNIKSCEVCAKGAIFVAAVSRYNKEKIYPDAKDVSNKRLSEIVRWDSCMNGLDDKDIIDDLFEKKDWDTIELYFEGEDVNTIGFDKIDIVRSEIFFKSHKNAKERMVAIMKNLIKNKGRFVPTNIELDQDLYVSRLEKEMSNLCL